MSEIRLQSDIVRKFSELYPEKRGQLFHVANERNHKLQAFQAKAIGIFSGVSDLIYFSPLFLGEYQVENSSKILGIEVKELGKSHKKDHIECQIDWGRTLERNGGKWVLSTSVESAIEATLGNYSNCLSISDVEELLKKDKLKTIKF